MVGDWVQCGVVAAGDWRLWSRSASTMTIAAMPTPTKVNSTLLPSVAKFVGSGRSKAVRIRAVSSGGEEGEVHREDGSGQSAGEDDDDF